MIHSTETKKKKKKSLYDSCFEMFFSRCSKIMSRLKFFQFPTIFNPLT